MLRARRCPVTPRSPYARRWSTVLWALMGLWIAGVGVGAGALLAWAWTAGLPL